MLLKKHLGGHKFHNNEEVNIAVREWLQLHEPVFLCATLGQTHRCAWGLCRKMICEWNKSATFNFVMACLIFMMWGTLPVYWTSLAKFWPISFCPWIVSLTCKMDFFSDQKQVSNADSIVAPDDRNKDGRRSKHFLSVEIQPVDSLVSSSCVS